MMQIIDSEKIRRPIKIWVDDVNHIEESCLEQAYHLANLPFIYQWVALMPDTHTGMGMPIGGVIACQDVIIPHAVGNDIGCGMAYISTDVPAELLTEIITPNGTLLQAIVGDILRNIPVGFAHHKTDQPSKVLAKASQNPSLSLSRQSDLLPEIEAAYRQIGTLGGGNHFIELQKDEAGYLAIMLHSGSRRLGKEICHYFNQLAKMLNARWHTKVPEEYGLPFLPIDSEEGQAYLAWMTLALDFAEENRAVMLEKVKQIVEKWLAKMAIPIHWQENINCHHNYAALEHHYGRDVWVHRKGATSAQLGQLAVIPGAMGSFSYIVEGLGNAESFCSSSHGAGRLYSRKGAMKAFSQEEVIVDLKKQGVVLGKHHKTDIAEESRFAYKNIEEVMALQNDLVIIKKRLQTMGVIKG